MSAMEVATADGLSQGELVRYGLRYVGWYFLTWLVLAFVFYIFPQWSVSGASIAMVIMAAGMTYSRFLKDRGRLPSKSEYWGLVLLSTALSISMELLITLFIVAQGGMPKITLGIWLGVVALAAFRGVFGHMIFYSKYLGTTQLKRIEKKQKSQV